MKKEVWVKLVKRIGNWIVNICFYSCVAFVAWMVLQVFCLTSFKIPSNSMEPALLSGDKILVDMDRRSTTVQYLCIVTG